MSRHVKAVTIAPIRYVGRRLGQLVVRFRHLAPIAACPRPNVGIARTTRNDKFRVAFLNVAFVRRDCRIGDTNVKFTPLAGIVCLTGLLAGCSGGYPWQQAQAPQPTAVPVYTPPPAPPAPAHPIAQPRPTYQAPAQPSAAYPQTPHYPQPAPAIASPAPNPAPHHPLNGLESAGGLTHTVALGDTVYNISKRFGVTKEAIQAANGLDFDYTIKLGQQLTIPQSGGVESALPAPVVPAAQPGLATATTYGHSNRMVRPAAGQIIRPYGVDIGGARNNGIGIAAAPGSSVLAADSGKVIFVSQPDSSVGSVVMVEHPGGMISVYGRLSEVVVRDGQTIARGMPIAKVAPALNDQSYVHFELRHGSQPVDPTAYI